MSHLLSLDRLMSTRAPRAVALVRVAIAFVFVTEGIYKFVDPIALGAGRFAKIGIPAPEAMGPLVGVVEIAGGTLVVIGLLTRPAAFALMIDMLVAIVSTKVPILIGHGFWGFADPAGHAGFGVMAHEARTDVAMLLGCIFLMASGGGQLSLDHRLSGLRRPSHDAS